MPLFEDAAETVTAPPDAPVGVAEGGDRMAPDFDLIRGGRLCNLSLLQSFCDGADVGEAWELMPGVGYEVFVFCEFRWYPA